MFNFASQHGFDDGVVGEVIFSTFSQVLSLAFSCDFSFILICGKEISGKLRLGIFIAPGFLIAVAATNTKVANPKIANALPDTKSNLPLLYIFLMVLFLVYEYKL